MSESEACSGEDERTSDEIGESDGGSGTGSSSSSYDSTDSASSSDSEDGSEEEIEPVLKYKRFARDVITSISQSHDGEKSNVICCIAAHSKVCLPPIMLALRSMQIDTYNSL